MKFSIQQIKNEAFEGPVTFEEKLDVSELLSLPNNEIIDIGEVFVYGMYVLENHEIIFSFTIEGEMILPCARTLVEVNYPFRFRGTEIFTTKASVAAKEEEIHHVTEEVIDLRPYILETILLQKPYRVFAENAEVQDGEGWSFYTEDRFEEEKKQKVDPRLAKLQKLLDEKKDES